MSETKTVIEPRGKTMTVFGGFWKERHNLALASVVEATTKPGLTHDNSVVDKLTLVTSPHTHSWMISPAFSVWVEEGFEYLQALDTLLAEALIVKHLGTAAIVGIWKERLHYFAFGLLESIHSTAQSYQDSADIMDGNLARKAGRPKRVMF
jgi:hypothetical protein